MQGGSRWLAVGAEAVLGGGFGIEEGPVGGIEHWGGCYSLRAPPTPTLKPPAAVRVMRPGRLVPPNASLYRSARRSKHTFSPKPETK